MCAPALATPPPVALAPPCSLCECAPAHRRTLCRACYRKLKEHGIPLPPARRPGPPPGTPSPNRWDRETHLRAWAQRLPHEARALLLAVLGAPHDQPAKAA